MRQWPELALVCEYIPDSNDAMEGGSNSGGNDDEDSNGITPLREYLGRVRNRGGHNNNNNESSPKKEIVGYILGKVEDRPVMHPPVSPARQRPPSKVVPLYDGPSHAIRYNNNNPNNSGPSRWDNNRPPPQWEKTGHVTSLAVHTHARRLGIASSLLRQLHYHLTECYSAKAVGLHVRISNSAAVKLYVETLEYDVADIIPQYYGDGEDAYFMRKELRSWDELNRIERLEVPPLSRHSQRSSRGNTIPDWVNRDVSSRSSSSSFYDNHRSSIRDNNNAMLSPQERAWVNTSTNNNNNNNRGLNNNYNNHQSLSGKVTRGFRTFLHGNNESNDSYFRNDGGSRGQRPPWETGPEELRLPRYSKIVRDDVTATGMSVGKMEGTDTRRHVNNFARGEDAVVDGFEEAVATGTC